MHSFAVDGSIEEGLAKKRTAVDSMGRGKVACNNVQSRVIEKSRRSI